MLDTIKSLAIFSFYPLYIIFFILFLYRIIKHKDTFALYLVVSQLIISLVVIFVEFQEHWESNWSDFGVLFPLFLFHLYYGLHLSKASRPLRMGVFLFFGLVGFFNYLPNFKYDLSGQLIRLKAKATFDKPNVVDVMLVPGHPYTLGQGSYYGGISKKHKVITIEVPFNNQEIQKVVGLETEYDGINFIYLDQDKEEEFAAKQLDQVFQDNFIKKDYRFFSEKLASHPYAKGKVVRINAVFYLKK